MLTMHASVNESIVDLEPKTNLHPEKIMLSVWWDFQSIIYFELLPPNTTIDCKLYCNQLQNLKVVLQVKRPERHKIRLLYDHIRQKSFVTN